MRRHHNAGPHVRRRQYTSTGIWLGLFAMLMIHVGPLFSALQAAAAPTAPLAMVAPHDAHAHHDHHAHDALADAERHGGHGMHHRSLPGEPAWLAALEMCGYCELLTLNPPLNLAPQLVLPWYQPTFFLPLPETPHPAEPRRGSGHPRAPPLLHG